MVLFPFLDLINLHMVKMGTQIALFSYYTPFSFTSHQNTEENSNKAYPIWLRVSFPWSHCLLQNYIKYITNSDKIFVPADKSQNNIETKLNWIIILNWVKKSFWRKTTQGLIRNPAFKELNKIDKDAKCIAKGLKIE